MASTRKCLCIPGIKTVSCDSCLCNVVRPHTSGFPFDYPLQERSKLVVRPWISQINLGSGGCCGSGCGCGRCVDIHRIVIWGGCRCPRRSSSCVGADAPASLLRGHLASTTPTRCCEL